MEGAHRQPEQPGQVGRRHRRRQDVLGAQPFDAAGEDERVAFRPAFVTNSADAAIGHAERGGGIAMALSYQVVDAVRRGALRVVLAKFEPPTLPIQLVYPASRLVSASLRAFIELAVETRKWSFVDL